ncbi:sulfatase [Sabulilitoribacter arenilitoris]|uniref:Sulfatase n=1 Tax=Wocania arenilitoris TaxID=2044858 RepID=A0AAE3EQH9_9FLAO|nr:sulfatase [Wocania arenilitoris]MCF7568230.1 sulfatase [Wocania arenilitoris]
MNRPLIFLIALSVLTAFGCSEKTKSNKAVPDKPNIILFLVDDMGWQDTSVPFWDRRTPLNDIYQTPNMERLASQGVKFTNAYATSVCSPTRVSLMTGMNAARHRVTNWTLRKDVNQPMEDNHKTLSFPQWNVNGISPSQDTPRAAHATTLPQLLQGAGYHTIHVGKAHFGARETLGANPTNLGFDVNIAGHAAGGPGSYLGTDNFGNRKNNVWGIPGLEVYHGKDIFLTEALTLEAKKALDASLSKEEPFFLYMSHYAIHVPLMADKRFIQKYLDKGMPESEAKYAALIEGMDKSLGDLMDYIEEKNIVDNTIILFMSDNGGLSAHARAGEKHKHNAPLNSGKGSIYEGGIREPMIVKWPSITKPNTVNDDYLIIEDFYPTILELAGVENYQTIQKIDGVSFTEKLKGKDEAIQDRPLFWHYPNEWGVSGPGIGAFSAVRQGDWKFIYFHESKTMELYNLKEDISEANNLIEQHTDKTKVLAKTLSDYLVEVGAQMPKYKETNKKVPLPIELF